MLKLVGSAVVVMCCGIAGMLVAGNYARRPADLRAGLSALQMLETEISYGATPLPEALAEVAQRCDRRVAALFSRAGRELTAGQGITAREAWDTALDQFYPHSGLNPADLAVLQGLGHSLGISDREDQLKHLHLTREHLKQEYEKAEKAAARNVKLWNYLGFLAGITVCLIFL